MTKGKLVDRAYSPGASLMVGLQPLNHGKFIERYFTIKEAAVILRRHERTIWRWTVEEKIAYHQPYPGCKILIPEREINRLKPREE